MIRWLTVILGVGLAIAALYALLATPPRPAPAVPSAAAHEEIDEPSRALLERVLRDAEAREERAR